jgi:hypothetical protein
MTHLKDGDENFSIVASLVTKFFSSLIIMGGSQIQPKIFLYSLRRMSGWMSTQCSTQNGCITLILTTLIGGSCWGKGTKFELVVKAWTCKENFSCKFSRLLTKKCLNQIHISLCPIAPPRRGKTKNY